LHRNVAPVRTRRFAEPSRSDGNTRLYTDSDLERLEVIITLARDMGVNLAGIEIILNMREKMVEMEKQMTEFATVGATRAFPRFVIA